MKKDVLRKLQLTELEMLKDVADFCEKNGIEYFLIAGTLLGAVRHGGFIPWDDDIDIGMTFKNYKKFLKLAPKGLPKKYFVQHFTTDPKVSIPWIKVRINGTTSMERHLTNYDIHYGICMDIFLFNGIAENKNRKKKQAKYTKEIRTWLLKWMYIEGDIQDWNTKKVRNCPEYIFDCIFKENDDHTVFGCIFSFLLKKKICIFLVLIVGMYLLCTNNYLSSIWKPIKMAHCKMRLQQ